MGRPPARGFASVRMSGTTPECWNANIFPVRPRPHWISSKTSSAPRSRQIASQALQELRRRRPDPALALDRLDHHRRGLLVHGRGHRRQVVPRDEMDPGHERLERLAVLGGPRRREGAHRAAVERVLEDDVLDPPCSFPILRANFIAPSHASVPEFVKKTFDGKASATRRSARALPGSLWNRLLAWMRVSACFLIAATTFVSP